MRLYVVLPDIHDKPPEDGRLSRKIYNPAYKCVEKVIEALQPYGTIDLGDGSEMGSLSYFDKDKRRLTENKRYKKDIESMKHLLDRRDAITKSSKEKIYHIGNHEFRVQNYIDCHPEQEGTMDYVNDTELLKRGYKVIPHNDSLKLGKALFMHGFNASTYHAAFMSKIYPKTIFYGHVHDVQTFSFVSPIDDKDIRIASSLGCLCDLNPSWMRNKPNRWVHAFGLFWLKDNGEFQMDIKYIIKGEVIVNGVIFKG